MNFKKAFKVIFVDFLGLAMGIINGFLLPKVFSIDAYAYLRSFTLYASYAGMFHLGFSDGIYVLLGGKKLKDISSRKLRGYFNTLLKLLFFVFAVLMVLYFTVLRDEIFKYFVIYIIPFQIVLFLSLSFRAVGEFDKYTLIKIAINMVNFISTLIVLFYPSPLVYMQVQVVTYGLIALAFSYSFIRKNPKGEPIKFSEFKSIIALGFTVMAANTLVNLFFSMDRWFIKFNFAARDFAYYSFGVSMLNLFLTLISSVTILFYPYLANSYDNEKVVSSIKKYIILICSLIPGGFYAVRLIVRAFIPKYIPSLEVLGILILIIPFITLTSVLYANIYKASRQGKKYLFAAIKMLLLAVILNIVAVEVFKNSIMLAYATLLSFIVWYVYSSKDFKGLKIEFREIILFTVYFVLFELLNYVKLNDIVNVFLYLAVMICFQLILFKEDFKALFSIIHKTSTRHI